MEKEKMFEGVGLFNLAGDLVQRELSKIFVYTLRSIIYRSICTPLAGSGRQGLLHVGFRD